MASGKIELALEGKYGAAQMWAQAQKDVKDFSRANKDAMTAGKQVVNELAGAVGGNLSTSLKTANNLIGDIARGGLWGAMASIASQAIGFAVQKFSELKESAEKAREVIISVFREDIRRSANDAADGFKNAADEIKRAKDEGKDALAVLNGEVAATASGKAVEIKQSAINAALANLEAQSTALASGMSAASVAMTAGQEAVAKAETDYALAMNKATASVEQAKNTRDAAEKAAGDAVAATARAETYLEEQVRHRAEMETTCSDYLSRRKELQDVIANAEELYKDGTITLEQSNKMELKAKEELLKLQEDHKDSIAALAEADKAVTAAQDALAKARDEEAAAAKAAHDAGSKVAEAENALALAESEGELARKKANLELEKEKAEQEARRQEEEKAEQAAKEKAEADIRLAEEAEARREAEKAAREAAELEAEQRKATVEQATDQIKAKIADIQAAKAGVQRGMQAEQEHTTGLFGPYQYHTDANGNIDNFIDFQRNRRFQERGARDDQWAARRDASWEDRIAKLQAKDPSKLTDSERKKLDDWKAYKDQKGDESELDQLADKITGGKTLADVNKLIEDLRDDLGLR